MFEFLAKYLIYHRLAPDLFLNEKSKKKKTKKPGRNRAFIMDGLVSTGKCFIPYTILNTIFFIKKNFFIFFINILICAVEKETHKITIQTMKTESGLCNQQFNTIEINL
jgi:hypothetical protein